ncbi:syntaxin-19 [Ambystoma mexicanum]|uniref:syntaxin-19 n=1 Tax=Ambystoma mexicanum TaxID=8296 RepID=UPI0037E7EFD4
MKDRLQELKLRAKELEESKNNDDEPSASKGLETEFQQQAVIFENEPVVESYMHEIQTLHEDINNLEEEVKSFGQQQKTLVSSMRRFSVMKTETDIAREIKIHAENINRRLDALSKQAKKCEGENGPSSGVTRILRSQHAALFRHFQKTMFLHNEIITAKQEACKMFIVRQLEVAGKEVSEEEVDRMVEQGKWDIFNENLLTDVKITKTQLSAIEQRHKELINLENQMKDLRELFLQISLLVEEQGEVINNIELATANTENYIHKTTEQIKLAVKYKKKHPCRVLCCCCCPCYD